MNTASDHRVMRVIGTAAMEGYVETLRSLVPSLEFRFEPVREISLESQQMDEAERQEALATLKEELEESLTGSRPTGPLQLFLLDSGGLAAADTDSQATLRALAKAALNDPSNTVAALLPEEVKSSEDVPTHLPEAVRSVVQEFLGATKAPVFKNQEELASHLATL